MAMALLTRHKSSPHTTCISTARIPAARSAHRLGHSRAGVGLPAISRTILLIFTPGRTAYSITAFWIIMAILATGVQIFWLNASTIATVS